MSILPVVLRELKSQARQPFTYWLRMLGGISVAAAFAVAAWSLNDLNRSFGRTAAPNLVNTFGTALFGKLNLFMFVAIWLLVPLSTADTISRERREGTLALLFLTELRSWGIVIGKTSAYIMRALSLFLTMAPWLMLPVLFGGVGLRDVAMALMLNFVALLLALAASFLASTIPRDRLKAIILAEVFSLVLLLWMLNAHERLINRAIRVGTPGANPAATLFRGIPQNLSASSLFNFDGGMIRRTIRQIEITTDSSISMEPAWYWGQFSGGTMETHWHTIWASLTPPGHQAWMGGVALMVLWAGLVLLVALWIAAWRVQRSWQDAPRSLLFQKLKQTLYSPRFRVATLRRNLSRSLTANPIGWLQHYSPEARMVKWGWCLFILLAEILLSSSTTDLYDAQAGLGLILLLGLGFSATGSFRNELETGAFELLLVTPLRERQIIFGRLRGLWSQFLPAIAIYGAGSVYLASGWAAPELARDAWMALARTLSVFCVLPVVGLYFSIQRLNFFAAWMSACAAGLLPVAVARAFDAAPHVALALQLVIGLVAGFLLERRLRSRGFLASARH